MKGITMSRSCSICEQCGVADINAQLEAGKSVREIARTFGVARATLARHAGHVEVGRPPDSGPPILEDGPPGAHLAAAEELINAVKVIRGSDFSAQDVAEAQQLRSLAIAVDVGGSNIAGLRELRLTLDQFRRSVFNTDPSAQQELAEMIAKISGGADPGRYDRVFRAAIAAGADEDAARAAGDAALGREHAGETWHQTMARLHPQNASKWIAEGAEHSRNGRR
jgi:transposase-like protein